MGTAASTARAQTASATDTVYTLRNTHIHEIHSAVNGRDYRLTVALPLGYAAASASRYPVLYLLDGAISLPVAAITYRVNHRGSSDSLLSVYLCDDIRHDRNVALKLLKPELAAVLGAERFVQEIKTTRAGRGALRAPDCIAWPCS